MTLSVPLSAPSRYHRQMRPMLVLFLTALPARAWEFSPVPVCTLTHATDRAEIAVTFDPKLDVPYALSISRSAPWREAEIFVMEFLGVNALTISTSRHSLSEDGMTLRVEDQGFGNVLNGLQFNQTARARLGTSTETFPLADAAPEVEAFRRCPVAVTS